MRADASFTVMGCRAHVIAVGGSPRLVDQARARLEELERRWSRFLATSEVSRLNRAEGRPVLVSRETLLLVRRALDGHALSAGRFDPTLLGAVLRAGYDETFEQIGASARGRGASALRAGAGRIEVDEIVGSVRLPDGVGFDPGGIGKGLAADLVADELVDGGAAGACVNLGGDLRVIGEPPDGDAWRVAVEDPRDAPVPVAVLRLADGAVATSSRVRRQWVSVDGSVRHHLVDPRTDRSACTPALAATVVAADGWRAEVLAKAALLDGPRGLELVDRLGAAALVVLPDELRTSADWSRFAAAPFVAAPGRSTELEGARR